MIKKIGIIGAGQMGNGIAHVSAACGYEVILNDISMDRAEGGLTVIQKNLARMVAKEKISQQDAEKTINAITLSSHLKDMADADLVIEAATENMDIKLAIFKELSSHVKDTAILASNTSSISITKLASATKNPQQFMGVHFMNPVPIMKLVELIRGIATDDKTFTAVQTYIETLHKTSIVSEDFPGFIVNRILMPMINEAAYTLYEGVAGVADIDTSMMLGTNHPMGPLTLADFIGLDTCLAIMNVLYDGFSDSKYRPCPLLVKYVEAGWLGRKTGRGFYIYEGNDTPVPSR